MSWKPPNDDEDYIVITNEWQGGKRNRSISSPMPKGQAKDVARRKRGEDENIQSAATPARLRRLLGR